MVYNSVSIQEVIARIVRNTRIQDSSYIQDMNEWIPEAMGYMKTQFNLSLRFADVPINFHKWRMPCDQKYIEAVEYNGCRLNYSSTVKAPQTGGAGNYQGVAPTTMMGAISPITKEVVENNEVTMHETEFTNYTKFCTEYKEVCKCPMHATAWYQTELDYLVTSFSDGVVRIHYRGIPVDKDGLPLIPDNQNYKEALYWYVRSKMYGAGYEEKQYQETDMMQRFEMYAARAIGEITYPTPDMKEQQLKTQVRFIPAANYYENFFRVDNNEKNYGY